MVGSFKQASSTKSSPCLGHIDGSSGERQRQPHHLRHHRYLFSLSTWGKGSQDNWHCGKGLGRQEVDQ